MHPVIFKEFEKICLARNAGGVVLEVGVSSPQNSLLTMKCLQNAKERIGIDLSGPKTFEAFKIVKGDANNMTCFEDNKFDTILCNAMLEHDKFFWKTISEIKRVAKKGGLIVIGVPGFKDCLVGKYTRKILRKIPLMNRYFNMFTSSTITYEIHDAPGDYYRYSPQALKEVFFEGLKDVDIYSVMIPPRIIGSGVKA